MKNISTREFIKGLGLCGAAAARRRRLKVDMSFRRLGFRLCYNVVVNERGLS
jgi:hypothetical protein